MWLRRDERATRQTERKALRSALVEIAEAGVMKRELGLLNVLCVIAAILFIVMAAVILLTSGQLLSTDNLFITMVCLVMALMFAVNPLLYLKSEGRLPIPFAKRLSAA